MSLLRNLAVNDSQQDLNNAVLFKQPGFAEQYQYFSINYSEFADNYTVLVSNIVLWCVVKVPLTITSTGCFAHWPLYSSLHFTFSPDSVVSLLKGFTTYVYKKEKSSDTVTIISKLKNWISLSKQYFRQYSSILPSSCCCFFQNQP